MIGTRTLLAAMALSFAGPCLADAPLAGGVYITATSGSPVCTSAASLQSFLIASVEHAPLQGYSGACSFMPFGARVTVMEDLPVRNAIMHVVRARVELPFPQGARVGYTYSKGFEPYGYGYNHFNGYLPFTYNTGPGF